MKIVFLDFDGVLNSRNYIRAHGHGALIDPSRMVLLKQIIDATGAQIVLSTSWKAHWDADPGLCDHTGKQINRIFSQFGLSILSKTPSLPTRREREIIAWLDAHPEVSDFVVLDDELLDNRQLRGRFVKTVAYKDGLDEECVSLAISILNKASP